jgi:hypothetical protein
VAGRLNQLRAIVREDGVGSLFKRIGSWIVTRFHDSGEILWFVSDRDTSQNPGDEFTAQEVKTPEQHQKCDALRPLDPEVQKLRESVGGQRWTILDSDGEINFICWTFRDEAIIAEKPTLKLPLPAGTFQLEDSYVPRARRKSSASVVAVELFTLELLKQYELESLQLITKIDVDNIAAEKALERGGWRRFASVTGTRWLSRFTRWSVRQEDASVFPELDRLAS